MLAQSIAKRDLASAAEILRAVGRKGRAAQQKPLKPLALEEVSDGVETHAAAPSGRSKLWLIRRPLAKVAPEHAELASRYAAVMCGARQRFDELAASAAMCHAADSGPEDLLFLDVETCGLSSAAIFLIGTMSCRRKQLVFEQFFARDYAEEAAILQAFAGRYAEAGVLVTFNGKAFDMNMIRERAAYHGVNLPDREPPHLDLLHESRRRWRGRLPNCRLQTLEQCLCGRHRTADIPSHAIPDAYHRFVDTKDARKIGDILRHNMLDMLTMAELVCLLLTGSDPAVE